MEYDKVKDQFGDWAPLMKDLIESEIFNNLYRFLKAEKAKGREILPKSDEVWKSLRLCSRHKVRAIILLQCPYATKRDGVTISNGIPMDCSNIAPYQQPSLYQWYQAIENQYGFDVDGDLRCDLSYLLKEEHVLLLNTSNTVEALKVDSHAQQWAPVMQWFIENVINKYLNGIPVVLVGTQAQKFEKYLNPLANPIKKVEHPAAASYANRDWKHEDMHLWCNKIIEGNNGREHIIKWTRKKSDIEPIPKAAREWINEDEVSSDLPWSKNNKI